MYIYAIWLGIIEGLCDEFQWPIQRSTKKKKKQQHNCSINIYAQAIKTMIYMMYFPVCPKCYLMAF